MNETSRNQGWAITGGAAFLALLFLIGILQGSYWAIALPVAVLTLFVLGLVAWVGHTIATVQVDISGTLPTSEGTQVISRSESWFCSKRMASTIPVESGDPPTGYRFLVTAHF